MATTRKYTCEGVLIRLAIASMSRPTWGDKAMLNPVTMIRAICMAKASRLKNPLYQEVMTSSGVDPIQISAPAAHSRVSRMANTKASGMKRRNSLVKVRPNFSSMTLRLILKIKILWLNHIHGNIHPLSLIEYETENTHHPAGNRHDQPVLGLSHWPGSSAR